MLVFQWVGFQFGDDDEAVCRLARDPDEVVCRFPRDPSVEPPTCLRVNRVVIFFDALKVLFFSLSYFVDCEEWFCILLGSLPGARRAIVCILFLLEQSRGRCLSGG